MTDRNYDLYIVRHGDVDPCDGTEQLDPTEAVYVVAFDCAHALRLAAAYDAGKIQPDNTHCWWISGQPVVAALDGRQEGHQ